MGKNRGEIYFIGGGGVGKIRQHKNFARSLSEAIKTLPSGSERDVPREFQNRLTK